MKKEEKKKLVSQEDIMKLLDSCYEKCLHGISKGRTSTQKYVKSRDENTNDYTIITIRTRKLLCIKSSIIKVIKKAYR